MNRILSLLCLFLLLPPRSPAGTAETTAFIAFQGTSTLHSFEGTAVSRPFLLTFEEIPETGQVRLSAAAALNVSAMSTANKKRDKNMLEMLGQKEFELISGTLPETAFPISGRGGARLRLSIRDTELPVDAVLSNWKRNGNQIRFDLAFPVSLAAFGLEPPSVLGVIRVGDTVTVTCEMEGTCQ